MNKLFAISDSIQTDALVKFNIKIFSKFDQNFSKHKRNYESIKNNL